MTDAGVRRFIRRVGADALDDLFALREADKDEGQIVEMLSVVGLFGFLNRWNETMATELEDRPVAIAHDRYGDHWEPGKHVR